MRRTGSLEGTQMARMLIARADRQSMATFNPYYLSNGGLLPFLLEPVARQAGDTC